MTYQLKMTELSSPRKRRPDTMLKQERSCLCRMANVNQLWKQCSVVRTRRLMCALNMMRSRRDTTALLLLLLLLLAVMPPAQSSVALHRR
jgi:hypothetical protein